MVFIDIKDGYIPYVEDTSYANTLTNENSVKKSSHFGLCKLKNSIVYEI